jgi:hypothetical protein
MVSGRLYSVYTVIICIRVKAIDPSNHNCNRTAEKWKYKYSQVKTIISIKSKLKMKKPLRFSKHHTNC